MAEITNIDNINYLINNGRVFLPSGNINIFPCSRRGQSTTGGFAYDPEARLNTERTNRLHTAINGFTDTFIINKDFSDGDTLEFVLAGYYIEAKNFKPADIAEALGIATGIADDIIYAHLSLHNDISLRDISSNAEGYATEILYRQNSDIPANKNYLDVHFSGNDFFFGVSFTSNKDASDTNVVPHVLPVFKRSAGGWELVQTSLLPNVKHGTTEDSIKVFGDATFNTNIDVQNKATITTVEVPYSVGELEGTTTITTGGIGTPYIYAKALAADGIAVGSEISIVDDLDPEKRTTIGHTKDANGDYTQDGIDTTNITVSGSITTPIIGVKTIKNTDAISPVIKVDDDLNVTGSLTIEPNKEATTDTLNVNTINSRSSDGVKVDATLEVTGNSTIGSNLNIGNPTTPANADNGGYIVAKNDITAEHDLIAQNNLTVTNHAQTKTLEILNTAEVHQTLNVTKVNSDDADAVAYIDSAYIGILSVGTSTITPNLRAATANVDKITSNADDGLVINPKTKINNTLEVIDITTLKNGLEVTNGETNLQKLTATEVSADTIIQNGSQVPVITLDPISTGESEIWQLQIAHVIKKSKN